MESNSIQVSAFIFHPNLQTSQLYLLFTTYHLFLYPAFEQCFIRLKNRQNSCLGTALIKGSAPYKKNSTEVRSEMVKKSEFVEPYNRSKRLFMILGTIILHSRLSQICFQCETHQQKFLCAFLNLNIQCYVIAHR